MVGAKVNLQNRKGPKNLLITGLPGVGKTTLVIRLSQALIDLHPAGFYTSEIREEGNRVGFELISLSGKRGVLSRINFKGPYRVGRYGVDIKGFEEFLDSIPFFDSEKDLVLVDEIGKMESFSNRFKGLVRKLFDSDRWVIATIAMKGRGFLSEIRERADIRLFELTPKNRDSLLVEILEYVLRHLPPESVS